MGRVHDEIDDRLRAFIEAQRMFFVATAPLDAGGHVNVSPKGLDSFAVMGPREVAYLDFHGSGAETAAHTRENGRITVMFCAFEGPPKIVRLYGTAEVIEPTDPAYDALRAHFDASFAARAVVRIAVQRISDSCGFGVPLYAPEGSRTQLTDWAERKGPEGLADYRAEHNARSIDGLPALRSVLPD